MKFVRVIFLGLGLLFCCGAAMAQTSFSPVTTTLALSGSAPYAANSTATLTVTIDNTLPASAPGIMISVTTTSTQNGAIASGSTNQTLVPATSNDATAITVTMTLPTGILSVGTLPPGVALAASTGGLTITDATLAGGGKVAIAVPVTFLAGVQ
jgi:hypothetical protein